MTSRRTAAGRALSPRIYRVVIVEDHALARAGLRTALNTDQQIEVVGEAANGLDGFRVIDEMKPDVAVIDIGLPGIDGIEDASTAGERAADARRDPDGPGP